MIKRIFDFTCASVGLIFFTPLLLLIGLLIKIKMPGPVFFKQKRVGQHGELFTMIKFRTMKVDHGGSSISVKGESRITPLGATLRKYKLDELPELWNVLKGEMSFVGPRPDVPGYADNLQGEDKKILLLKPGITGPASMKYSNEEEILALQSDPKKYNDTVIYPDKVRINLEYLKRRNMVMDLWFIILTIVGKKPKYSWI
ncbi:MAG: sugar transferase [Saprospiraceae bacterium]|nr:sugar transferase [Saprospiraceae bacterium]